MADFMESVTMVPARTSARLLSVLNILGYSDSRQARCPEKHPYFKPFILLPVFQPVPHPCLGHDVARLHGIVAKLLAQMLDGDAQGVVILGGMAIPDFF